jgi:hypothetical protein
VDPDARDFRHVSPFERQSATMFRKWSCRIYESFSGDFAVTSADWNRYWSQFHSTLLHYWQSDPVAVAPALRIFLQETISFTTFLSFPCDQPLLARVVQLLYDIISRWPIPNLRTTLAAVCILELVLKDQKGLADVWFDWRPLYRIVRFCTQKCTSSTITASDTDISTLWRLIRRINRFFRPDSTDRIMAKFLPRVSPFLLRSVSWLAYFARFVPLCGGQHRRWLPILNSHVIRTPVMNEVRIIALLYGRLLLKNAADDFSAEMPIIFWILMSLEISGDVPVYQGPDDADDSESISDKESLQALACCIVILIFSPPTRTEALRRFRRVCKLLYHHFPGPSVTSSRGASAIAFVDAFIGVLAKARRNLSIELPTDVLRDVVGALTELKLVAFECGLFASSDNIDSFAILAQLEPSIIDRCWRVAIELVTLTDVHSVGVAGWKMLVALVGETPTSPLLQFHFATTFDVAVSSLQVRELRKLIVQWLKIAAGVVLFPPDLAERWFVETISILRADHLATGGTANVAILDFIRGFNEVAALLFRDCSQLVIDALMPQFLRLFADADDEPIFRRGCSVPCFHFAKRLTQQERTQLLGSIRLEARRAHHAHGIGLLLDAFAEVARASRDVVEALGFLKQFTTHDQRKVRKAAWSAISTLCFPIGNVKVAFKAATRSPFSRGEFGDFDISATVVSRESELCLDAYRPLLDVMETSTDVQEVIGALKVGWRALVSLVSNVQTASPGSLEDVAAAAVNSEVNMVSCYASPQTFVNRVLSCGLRLFRDFPENAIIVSKAQAICRSHFSRVKKLGVQPHCLGEHTGVWRHVNEWKLMNCAELSDRVRVLFEWRIQSHVVPASPLVVKLLEATIELGLSSYRSIRAAATATLKGIMLFYYPVFSRLLHVALQDLSRIQMDDLLEFLKSVVAGLSRRSDIVLSVFAYLIDHSDFSTLNESSALYGFFLKALEVPVFKMFDELPENYAELLNKALAKDDDRTGQLVSQWIIVWSLRRARNVPPNVLPVVVRHLQSFDPVVIHLAVQAFELILVEFSRATIERMPIDRVLKVHEMPRILDENVAFSGSPVCWCLPPASRSRRRYTSQVRPDELVDSIPGILKSLTEMASDAPSANLWEHLARYVGPTIAAPLRDVFEGLQAEDLTEEVVEGLLNCISGILIGCESWDVPEVSQFLSDCVLPFFVLAGPNPGLTEAISSSLVTVGYCVNIELLAPLVRFLFERASSEADAEVSSRLFFSFFGTFVFDSPYSFATSTDAIYKKFIVPFVANFCEYPATLAGDLNGLLVPMINALTVPEFCGMHSRELDDKRNELVGTLEQMYFSGRIADRSLVDKFVSLLSYLGDAQLDVAGLVYPVIFAHFDEVCTIIAAADASNSEILTQVFSNLLKHPVFNFQPGLLLKFTTELFARLPALSGPVQQQLLDSLCMPFCDLLYSIPEGEIRVYAGLVRMFCGQCRDEDLLLQAVRLLGIFLGADDDLGDLEMFDAAGMIFNTFFSDDVPKFALRAFDKLAESMESGDRSERTFSRAVLTQFWAAISGHILPSVEEKLADYRMLVHCSYMT